MPSPPTRALITGASSGIGAAFAKRLAADGASLVLVARRRDRLEALAADLRATANVEVEVLAADLGDLDGVAAVESRIKADPAIDMVINNAGFGVYGSVTDYDAATQREMIQLNVVALTQLAIAAGQAMAPRGDGTIVNIASGLAFLVMPTNATYSGTKAYVVNFTRSMAMDLGPRGVRVQVLCPGIVSTEFGQRSGTDYGRLPPERVMQPDDLVAACLKGLQLGEVVCIPSLPDYADYQALEAAQTQLSKGVSRAEPAARYL